MGGMKCTGDLGKRLWCGASRMQGKRRGWESGSRRARVGHVRELSLSTSTVRGGLGEIQSRGRHGLLGALGSRLYLWCGGES